MRILTCSRNGKRFVGLLEGEKVQPLDAPDALSVIRAGGKPKPAGSALTLAEVRIEAPIPRPFRNIWCVGKNYHEHAHEFAKSGFDSSAASGAIPEAPIVFSKVPECVIAPGETIRIDPKVSAAIDYEAELAVVIGREGRGI